MMRKLLLTLLLAMPLVAAAQEPEQYVFTDRLKFNEGTVPYKSGVLISNFGTDVLNPLNTEGKGYITMLDGDSMSVLIPAAGHLSAPKGMAVLNNHLFVADVGKVVVFDLKRPKAKPQIVELASDDLFANDITVVGTIVLVSVTNTGRIYGIDASNARQVSKARVVGRVEGANGMVASDGKLYVASYDPGEKPTAANVIYVCDLVESESRLTFYPLIKGLPGGQYDGIAFSEDGRTLYFSSWNGAEGGVIYCYNFEAKLHQVMDFGVKIMGPADISVAHGMIYIPDLPSSKLYRFKL